MSLPLISIVIPVYNGANYMREAIESALHQTYPNIEVLVINDGSTDEGETEKVAHSYGDRIRYFHKENGGVSSALNYGIRQMKGEYFSWLSHDDVYAPDKVEMQVQVLQKYDTPGLVILGKSDTIDKDSKLIKGNSVVLPQKIYDWKRAVLYITQHGAHGCAFLIPKNAFEKAGLFDENLRYCQDILMWWQIFLTGASLAFCDHIGVHARVHGKQLTQTGAALYHHDAAYIGDIVAEPFANISDKEHPCLYAYTKGEAIHGNFEVVKNCLQLAKERKQFSVWQRGWIRALEGYGIIRPLIRKIYYKLFRNINTR